MKKVATFKTYNVLRHRNISSVKIVRYFKTKQVKQNIYNIFKSLKCYYKSSKAVICHKMSGVF